MNIFLLSDTYCPEESAKMQCDAHARKMGIESCQLLQTLFPLERLAQKDCPRTQKGTPRTWFNPKHPCSVWTSASKSHVDWLIEHARVQFAEYTLRYKKRHFTEDFLNWAEKNKSEIEIPDLGIIDFPIAINADKNCRKVAGFENLPRFEQYRLFYKMDKCSFAKWEKGRGKPDWMS